MDSLLTCFASRLIIWCMCILFVWYITQTALVCYLGILYYFRCYLNSWFVDMDPHSLIPPYHEAAPTSVELCDSTASEAGNKQYALSVQRRLKCCYVFWETELRHVLGIERSGCRLPFIRFPPYVCMRNNRSALEQSTFVATALKS